MSKNLVMNYNKSTVNNLLFKVFSVSLRSSLCLLGA